MRNIFVFLPELPKIGRACTPTSSRRRHQRNCLAETGAAAPPLVLPVVQVVMIMKNIGDPQPFVLDSAEPWRHELRTIRPIAKR